MLSNYSILYQLSFKISAELILDKNIAYYTFLSDKSVLTKLSSPSSNIPSF